MDDHLESVDTIDAAIMRIKQICSVHKEGGFEMCNWVSNSKEVLAAIPEDLRAKSTNDLLQQSKLPVERVLGLWWNAESDVFTFYLNKGIQKMTGLEKIQFPTKRQVLSAIIL